MRTYRSFLTILTLLLVAFLFTGCAGLQGPLPVPVADTPTDALPLLGVNVRGNQNFTGRVNLGGTTRLKGVDLTATAAELNTMDGITATVGELNDAEARLDALDGGAAGGANADLAVSNLTVGAKGDLIAISDNSATTNILVSNGVIDGEQIGDGTIDSDALDPTIVTNVLAAGWTVPAVSGEAITNINAAGIQLGNLAIARMTNGLLDAIGTAQVDDGTLVNADISAAAAIALTKLASAGLITPIAAAAASAEAMGDIVVTTISLTNVVMSAADSGDRGEEVQIADFDAGAFTLLLAVADCTSVVNGGVTDTYAMAFGTAAATADSALTSTEADIIPSTTLDTTAGTVFTNAFDAILAAPANFDGTGTAVDLYITWAIDDDATTNGVTNTVTGNVYLFTTKAQDN